MRSKNVGSERGDTREAFLCWRSSLLPSWGIDSFISKRPWKEQLEGKPHQKSIHNKQEWCATRKVQLIMLDRVELLYPQNRSSKRKERQFWAIRKNIKKVIECQLFLVAQKNDRWKASEKTWLLGEDYRELLQDDGKHIIERSEWLQVLDALRHDDDFSRNLSPDYNKPVNNC